MLEEDIKYYKEQFDTKDQEAKELAKECMKLSKQNNALVNDLKREERQYADSIKKLSENFEKENKLLSNKLKMNNPQSNVQVTQVGCLNKKCYSEEIFQSHKNEWNTEK